ncbi:MAG: fasciclin domain-containing protein [Armatimonadetes bacterium]|nr:fasciclin domain-containing protein [Armatimonadota bacterium]
MRRSLPAIALIVVALLLGGCAKQPETLATPPAETPKAQGAANSANATTPVTKGGPVNAPNTGASKGDPTDKPRVAKPLNAEKAVPIAVKSTAELPSVVAAQKDIGLFFQMAQECGVAKDVFEAMPHTFFVPTDGAIQAMGTDALGRLKSNKEEMKAFVLRHVSNGTLRKADLVKMQGIPMLAQGYPLSVKDGTVYVDTSKLIRSDIETKRGVIHVLDRTLNKAVAY